MSLRENQNTTISGHTTKYTNEDIIAQVLMLADERGRTPTLLNFAKDERTVSTRVVWDRFGSWNNLLEAAGLRLNIPRCTDEELIAQAQMMAKELGRAPKKKEFIIDSRTASAETVLRRFGSWNRFLSIAELKPNRMTEFSDDELIKQVQTLAAELGKTPTQKEFEKDSRTASIRVIKRHFGSWNKFLQAAGIELNVKTDYTNQLLIAQAQMLAKELGRAPTSEEFKHDPRTASQSTPIKRFGSWRNFLVVAGVKK